VTREPVGIEKAHEELKVLLLAVVGRRGQEQEVAGVRLDSLGEQAPLGLLDLASEELCRELVRSSKTIRSQSGPLSRSSWRSSSRLSLSRRAIRRSLSANGCPTPSPRSGRGSGA